MKAFIGGCAIALLSLFIAGIWVNAQHERQKQDVAAPSCQVTTKE